MGKREVIYHLAEKDIGYGYITTCGKTVVKGQTPMPAVLASDPRQAATCPHCKRIANGKKKKVSVHTR